MGSVFKNGKYWWIRYDLPPGSDGKRRQKKKSCKGMTKKEAELELGRLESEVYHNNYRGGTKETVGDYFDRWLDYLDTLGYEASSLDGYRLYVRCYIKPTIGGLHLGKVTPLHIQEAYDYLSKNGRTRTLKSGNNGLAARTIIGIHAVISHGFKQAVHWKLITSNPAQGVILPRAQRPEKRAASPEELAITICKIQRSKYRIPAWIALFTGMRRSEVIGLRWEDFDAENRILTIRRSVGISTTKGVYEKTTKTTAGDRDVLISDGLVTLLRDHRKEQLQKASDPKGAYVDQGWICTERDGRRLNPKNFSQEFSRKNRRAGVDLTLHELRHTQATVLFEAGVQDLLVTERLGHANVNITKTIYTHVKTRQQATSVEAIDSYVSKAQELAQRQSNQKG